MAAGTTKNPQTKFFAFIIIIILKSRFTCIHELFEGEYRSKSLIRNSVSPEFDQNITSLSYVNKQQIQKYDNAYKLNLFLLRSGDIHPKPGPGNTRKPKFPCLICQKGVIKTSKAVSCDQCQQWTHIACTKTISTKQYETWIKDEIEFDFTCDRCLLENLPFNYVDNIHDISEQTINTSYNHNHHASRDDIFKPLLSKGLHFIHCNARSLLPKISELRLIGARTKAAVLCITETWLDNSVTNTEVKIDGYSLLRKDRSRTGGGVCAYIRGDLAFTQRTDLQQTELEAIWFDILLPKTKPILVGNVYRPPKETDFINKFEETLCKINPEYETFIFGDFNVCVLHKMAKLCRDYLSLLKIFNLKQIITNPTRVTNSSSTLIDHIIVSRDDKISLSGVIASGLSDHYMTFCTRKGKRKGTNKQESNTIKIRTTKNYDKSIFVDKLMSLDWSELYLCRNVNIAWEIFKKLFMSVLNEIAPMKEIKMKCKTEPWITLEILELIRERDQNLVNYNKIGDSKFYIAYCLLRNKVQRKVKDAKESYFENKIEENRNNPKKLWQQFKNLGYSHKQKESANIVLETDKEVTHDADKIVNHFNVFFTTIAESLVAKLPKAEYVYDTCSNIFNFFL